MVHLILFSSVLVALMGRGKSKYFFAVACWILFLFAALRYMYGNDYPSYYMNYLMIRSGDFSVYDEWLFTAMNWLSPSFYVLIAGTSAVFVYSAYRLISGCLSGRDAWLGLLVFVIQPMVFLMNLSAIRQCLAMLCFMAAVRAAADRRAVPYVLWIALGCLCHKSAVILLPVWFFANDKPVRRRQVLLAVAVLFLLMFVVDLNAAVLVMAELFGDANYIHYVTQDLGNSVRATLLSAISLVYVLGNLPRLKGWPLVCGKLYLVSTVMAVLAYHISMLTRVQMYFDIFSVAAIPAILRTDLSRGVIRVDRANVAATLWNILNRFALPTLVFTVYVLRYYSFFTNPSWSAFFEYQSVFSAG